VANGRDARSAALSAVFRVDADPRIGIGHLIRCLTLADALVLHGAALRFVSRRLAESLRMQITSRGHEFHAIDYAGDTVDEGADAAATARAIADRQWDWIVADHYALGARWERAMRAHGRHILAIDDLADRHHDCDAILDQNYFVEGEQRYLGKVPADCEVLAGPTYALLRPEYREHRERLRRPNKTPGRVFVFFGGTAPFRLNALAVEALSDPQLRHLEIDLVCGGEAESHERLRHQASGRAATRIHALRPHLADLMADADLALGAAGTTTWERMCLGLPSLVVTTAENQLPISRRLAEQKLIRLIGGSESITADDIRRAMLAELHEPNDDAIREGMRICDGAGTLRVVASMRRRP
jgi:UDP-2,4-diacetamido-2,4,6-trideoxy-beta-L-altropyranose hydrolase